MDGEDIPAARRMIARAPRGRCRVMIESLLEESLIGHAAAERRVGDGNDNVPGEDRRSRQRELLRLYYLAAVGRLAGTRSWQRRSHACRLIIHAGLGGIVDTEQSP